MLAVAAEQRAPRISELGTDLLRLTWWQVARTIAIPFVAFAAYWMFAIAGLWVPAVLSVMIFSFCTYGSTSHDLVHRSLGLKPLPNDVLLSIIELLALRSGHAYQAAHLNHHARFPHADDIEGAASRMSMVRALGEGVVFQIRIYFWALRKSSKRRLWIVGEGLGILAILAVSVAVFPWTHIPAVYVSLMIAGNWIIPLITAYLPHDAEAPDVLHQTRLFRGALVRGLAFDHLYHLEHHLYPAVPHQNWPRLAKRLDPWLKTAGIVPVRFWS